MPKNSPDGSIVLDNHPYTLRSVLIFPLYHTAADPKEEINPPSPIHIVRDNVNRDNLKETDTPASKESAGLKFDHANEIGMIKPVLSLESLGIWKVLHTLDRTLLDEIP